MTEAQAQRIFLKGIITEADLEAKAEAYKAELDAIITKAKDLGDDDFAALMFALTLVSLEMVE